MSETITADALAVLRDARADGNRIVLPPAQLPRPLYEEVNDVLERLGGKWRGGRVRAHEFPYDPTPMLAGVVATGLMPPKNPLAYFATPPAVVHRMLTTCMVAERLAADAWLLEPSAGTGNIIAGIRALDCAVSIEAVEVDPFRAAVLRERYGDTVANVYEADFLTWDAPRRYDAIAMNPPFATPTDRHAYVAHIRRAYDLLKPGGIVVAVAPAALAFRTTPRAVKELRELALARGGLAELDAKAFWDSGTNVSCVICWLVADGDGLPASPLPHVAAAAPRIATWQQELAAAKTADLDSHRDTRTVAELLAVIRQSEREIMRGLRELERTLDTGTDAPQLPLFAEPTP
jgi:predicted RNA methylase